MKLSSYSYRLQISPLLREPTLYLQSRSITNILSLWLSSLETMFSHSHRPWQDPPLSSSSSYFVEYGKEVGKFSLSGVFICS